MALSVRVRGDARVPAGKKGGGKRQPGAQRVGEVRTLKPIRAAGTGKRTDD